MTAMTSLRRFGTRGLASFLALLLPLTDAPAKDADAPAPVTQAAQPISGPIAKPALWKIADKDTTIWLFGTIHILPPGVDWYRGPVEQALTGSDTLVIEVADPSGAATVSSMARLALSEPPTNLREGLSPADRKAYEDALAKLHLPAGAFDANDPWYAAVMVSLLPLLQQGFGTMNGAETQLVSEAKARGMKQVGLETAEYQLGLFDGLPADVQRKYLAEIVRNLPEIPKEVEAMVSAWKAGKADDLARLMNEDESDPRLMKVLLTDRNRTWSKWIEARMKQPGTVFVAVGAGHMAGKDSVLSMLKADRFKVVRVQ